MRLFKAGKSQRGGHLLVLVRHVPEPNKASRGVAENTCAGETVTGRRLG